MQTKSPKLFLTLFALVLLMTSLPALADTLTLSPGNCGTGASCDTFTFTTTVTQNSSTSFSVTFDVKDTGAGTPKTYDNAYLQGFGLTLFTGNISGASVTSTNPTLDPSLYSLVANSTSNNGNNNCGGGQSGAICLQVLTNGAVYLTQANPEQSFTFLINLSTGGSLIVAPNTWHIMANGTVNPDGKGANVFALSNDGTPTDPPPVPEPASMVLFGTGLIGVAKLVRRNARG